MMDSQLVHAMVAAMSGDSANDIVETIEKREQQSAVGSKRLPKKTNRSSIPEEENRVNIGGNIDFDKRMEIIARNNIDFTKKQYEKMGIKIIEDYDDLFYSVELPEGWNIEPTDHSMWNRVVDDKGRVRISFFYKGVFYDRDAFSNFIHRYNFEVMPFDDYKSDDYKERERKPWTAYITDSGKRIKTVASITPTCDEEYFSGNDKLADAAKKYLDENYPDWKNINAYWDETD